MSTDHLPINLNHSSPDFINVKEELMRLLDGYKGDFVRTTIYPEPNQKNTYRVTFTLMCNDMHVYLSANAKHYEGFENVGKVMIPKYELSDFTLNRQGLLPNDLITETLKHIFSSNATILLKYLQRMNDAIKEHRDYRIGELKTAVDTLINGQSYEW